MRLKTFTELKNGRFSDPESSIYTQIAKISPFIVLLIYMLCAPIAGKAFITALTAYSILIIVLMSFVLMYLALCDCYIE